MYSTKKTKHTTTSFEINNSVKGETIEQKIDRIVNNKEPISDGAPITYTERREGVRPEFNIRTDKWDLAIDAMDKVSQSKLQKRQDRLKKEDEEAQARLKKDADTNSVAESAGGTNP